MSKYREAINFEANLASIIAKGFAWIPIVIGVVIVLFLMIMGAPIGSALMGGAPFIGVGLLILFFLKKLIPLMRGWTSEQAEIHEHALQNARANKQAGETTKAPD